jgi:peptidyl-prolyl cis-trans isomerase SurA
MKKYFFYIFLFTLLVFIPGFSQQVVDGIAAIVGDDIVLISDINMLIMQYAFQNKINVNNQPELYQQLGERFLKNLIEQKLLLIKADEDTIEADEDRVEQAVNQQIDYMIQQAGSATKLEEFYSSPLYKIKSDFRKEVSNQMRISMLREKKFFNIKISRKEVEEFYKTYQDSLPKMKATVDISHILMQITPSEESVQQAFQRIKEIQQKLEQGENFVELARRFSEDPGSAQQGGELGFVSRGTFVKEFEETAFALKEGEISQIVQTQFGFHIIQLLEKQGEKINTRHILIKLEPTISDEQRIINKLNKIRNHIITGDTTFQEMALKYSDDPNVTKDNGNLGEYEEGGFQIKEFEKAVSGLDTGEISTPFRTEFGYHIVRLNKKREARLLSLKNDWGQIEQWALQNKREKEFEKWLIQLKSEIPVINKLAM